jgi:hypothetical protein
MQTSQTGESLEHLGSVVPSFEIKCLSTRLTTSTSLDGRIVLCRPEHVRSALVPAACSALQLSPMLMGSLVTAAWRVLGLQIEETASRYGG